MKQYRTKNAPKLHALTQAMINANEKPSRFKDYRHRPPAEPKKVPPFSKSKRPITLVKIP